MQNEDIFQQFENATTFSDKTRDQLTEKEQFYSDDLISRGYEIRFDDKKIFNRKADGKPISILRLNIN